MELLIATFNQGKLEDYKKFCKGLEIEPVNLQTAGINQDFEEIYPTFEENAKTKAEFYARLSGLPTIADDSGMEIPFYNNEPGVKTKRWAGEEIKGQEYFDFIISKIRPIPEKQKQGRMRTILALHINGQTFTEEAVVEGTFTDKPYSMQFTPGYPWRSVFILKANGKYYDELNPEEHDKYNHRKLAFDKLKRHLK